MEVEQIKIKAKALLREALETEDKNLSKKLINLAIVELKNINHGNETGTREH